jgi:hypothetical protein
MTPAVNSLQRSWTPFKRQADFLSLPDSIFEALYGGAAGGGKTETLLILPISRKFFEHPRFKMLFLRRTFPELDREVIPRSKEFYNAAGFNTYNDQKKRWQHPSGAIVQFGHCENPGDVAKYDTAEYNLIAFDELTSFLRSQYLYLAMSRCRSSSANLPAIVRSGTNPGNVGHGFARDRFVKPARAGYTILKETREFHGKMMELKRIFIPSKAEDNPHLMVNDPNYLARLNSLPAAERAAKLLGDWWSFSGQVFDDWRETHVPGDPDNWVHVIEPFRIPDYWPKVLSIDWGFSAMTCAGWYAINPKPSVKYPAKIYKYREYTCSKTKISSWATDIARLSSGEEFCDVVLDKSGWKDDGTEKTIAQQFAESSGLNPRRSDSSRVAGKLLLQEYIRLSPRPSRYVPQEGFDHDLFEKIDRLKGPKFSAEYASLFQPEETESFLPKFQVFNTCLKTIEAIPLCVYLRDSSLVSDTNEEGNSEDVAEFPGDDPYDETRYGLMACQHYLDGGKYEHQIAEKRAEICAQLADGGSVTNFYMRMDNLEASEGRGVKAIKRFHGGKMLKKNW